MSRPRLHVYEPEKSSGTKVWQTERKIRDFYVRATSIPKVATSTIFLLGNPPTLLMHFVWYTYMFKLYLKTNLHMAWDRKIQMSE